jgi:hypothetical protein
MCRARVSSTVVLLLSSLTFAVPAYAVAKFVPGFVPDWNQP